MYQAGYDHFSKTNYTLFYVILEEKKIPIISFRIMCYYSNMVENLCVGSEKATFHMSTCNVLAHLAPSSSVSSHMAPLVNSQLSYPP